MKLKCHWDIINCSNQLCKISVFGSFDCGTEWGLVKRGIMSHNTAGNSVVSQKGHQFSEVVSVLFGDLFFQKS